MATSWTFPTTAPDDDRRALPIFTISPNWKNGITETLAWLTDIMTSEQAVEQRRSARRFPRRTFEASFQRVDSTRARIDSFLAGMGKKKCLYPMWHEQWKLGPGRDDGVVQFPTGSLIEREYGYGDLVMITRGTPDSYFILTVVEADVANDTIRLAGTEASGAWPAGARIVPLRVARVMDAVSLGNVSDRVGTSQIRFQLTEADERFTPSWGYCSPLWRFKPDRADAISMQYDRQDYVLDFEAGVIAVTEPGNRAEVNQGARYVLYGRPAVWKARLFFYNARGRARRFYMPTFMQDIHVLDDIYGPSFDAQPNGFSNYMGSPQEARKIIGVDFKDGRPSVYRTIIGIEPVQSTSAPFAQVAERFTLDADMPPILKRDIERINFIVPSRFDQDTIEIFHPTDDSTVAQLSLVTRSQVVDGMPPIECWTTSRPYAAQAVESLVMSAVITGGLDRPAPKVLDEIGITTATIKDGTLLVKLHAGDAGVDEFAMESAILTDGTIRSVLKGFDAGHDEFVMASATLKDGTIKTVLVKHTVNPADEFTMAAKITEGTLA